MLNVAFCSFIGIIRVFSAKFTTEVFPDVALVFRTGASKPYPSQKPSGKKGYGGKATVWYY
jgi:hypothetical protein